MSARWWCGIRHWRRSVAIAIVAALALAAQGSVAKADGPGCSVGDFVQALKDTWNQAPPLSCLDNYDDPVYWAFYVYIGAGAAGAPPGGPNPMQDACAAIKSATQTVNDDVAGPVKKLWGLLGSDNQAALQSNPLLKDIASNVSDYASLAPIMICACDMVFDHGLAELTGDAGACVVDALCAANNWFHDNVSADVSSCSDSRPPLSVVDCANVTTGNSDSPNLSNALHTANGNGSGNCGTDDSGAVVPCLSNVTSNDNDPFYTHHCTNGTCLSNNGGLSVAAICYCPAPMVLAVLTSGGQPTYGDGSASCDCPAGTTRAGAGPLARTCLCGNGLPINADGSCPTPKPAPPPAPPKPPQPPACTVAGTVRLADGLCCAPTQATSCGVCCPAGQKPDATGASCISAQPVKYLPPFKQSPLKPTFTPGTPAKP